MSLYDDDGGHVVPPSGGYEHAGLGSTGQIANHGSADMAADELKSILTRISTQISDVERRHGDALDAMADRLSQMGGQAQTAKARTPVQDAQAFERIEDSRADLPARLPNTAQGQPAEVAPVQFAEQIALPEMPTVLGGQAPVQTDGEVFKVASAVAPAANGAHEAAEPSANPAQCESWDQEAADALTSLYYPESHDAAEEDLSVSSGSDSVVLRSPNTMP